MTGLVVRELRTGEHAECEQILRVLPEWFGIEASLLQYVRNLFQLEAFVAETAGSLLGFVSLRLHNQFSAEIDAIAVRPEVHGLGIGRAMIRHVEGELRSRSVEYLQVKTLGPSRPDEHYERTRHFYEVAGFRPLEENSLWGEVNPCLIMVKYLGAEGAVQQRAAPAGPR